MTYDASSRKDIRAAEKSAARLANDRLQFLRAALSTREGRAWFYHFLADCGVFHVDPVFEPHRDYFLLGQRNVGMRIFAEIKTNCPDQFILMEREENVRLSTATPQRPHSPSPGRDLEGRGERTDPTPDPVLDPFADPADGDAQ